MKRRLFALLLAVVMVLGLAATALGEGETAPAGESLSAGSAAEDTAGTQDAESTDEPANTEADTEDETKAEDEANTEGEVKSEDGANTEGEVKSEDDANAEGEGETKTEGEVNTEGEVTNDAAEDNTAAEGGDSDELSGEPQPIARGLETHYVNKAGALGAGFRPRTTDGITFNGSDWLVDPYDYDGVIKLLFDAIPAHCTLTVEDKEDEISVSDTFVTLVDTSGDGKVTLVLEEDPHIEVTVVDNTGLGLTVTQEDGTPYQNGDHLYRSVAGPYALKVSPVPAGLVAYTTTENGFHDIQFDVDPETGIVSGMEDIDKDGKVTLQLDAPAILTVNIVNDLGAPMDIKVQRDGTPVVNGSKVSADSVDSDSVVLEALVGSAYDLESGNERDIVDFDRQVSVLYIEDGDADGVVTIVVAERPTVTVLVQGAVEKAVLKDEAGAVVKSGDKVYFDSLISVTVSDSAYTVLGDRFCMVYQQGTEGEYTVEFYAWGSYRPEQITLRVVPYVSLHKEGEGLISVSEPYADEGYEEGDQLLAGESYYAEVKSGFAVEVTGGTVKLSDTGIPGGYVLDPQTGVCTRRYEVTPDGSGPVTVKAVPTAEQAPTPIKISYVDQEGAFSWDEFRVNYCWPGDAFTCMVKDGYGITVTGGTYEHRGNEEGLSYFLVSVDDDATALTVTTVKLATGAVLKVSGSLEGLAGSYGGDTYEVDGSVLANGHGYVLVKSGYAITGVTGGRTEYDGYATDWDKPGTGEIYAIYYVEASEAAVTLTVSAAAPDRWVKVNIVNNFEKSGASAESYLFIDENGSAWVPIIPNEPLASTFWVYLDDYADDDVSDYTVAVQGGTVVDEYLASDLSFSSYEIDPGSSSEVTVTLVKNDLQPTLQVAVPDKPAAGTPGVPDKAVAEKQLMDKASAVVDAALQGQTPAGVSKADAAAIAKAAAEGKTITTQLVATAVTAPADAAALQTAAGKDTITQYVDIQIVVLADGQQIGHITETDQALSFAVVLSDEELAKGGIFYVIRSHDGATTRLDAQLNGNVLSFSSDKFSTFAVANSNDIAFAQVEAIADQTWTGSEVKPAVKVTVNGSKTLTEGVDYTVSYKNNVGTGTATVVITGIGSYTGTKEVTFQIVAPAPTATPAPTAKPAGTTKPAADIPATGDETPLALYAGLLALSLAGLALVLGRKKRTEK